ncbi:hypothetical protein HRM2_20770 [Desulforapulum autotrophicum HRM2]|uniref:Uncharacterized protein n=1 Tax=Desulforapulum autotrophicum (strain ATCC 43914 / DSM 3382 / VKM B-1955 / HRM2) TaxID=177437 RepID=C0QDB2_DESAH|nr:hypothetical protein HRM2_20770 [Desulforapulum autotrophicum HRM2]
MKQGHSSRVVLSRSIHLSSTTLLFNGIPVLPLCVPVCSGTSHDYCWFNRVGSVRDGFYIYNTTLCYATWPFDRGILPLAPGLKLVGREVAVFFGGSIEPVHINKGQIYD